MRNGEGELTVGHVTFKIEASEEGTGLPIAPSGGMKMPTTAGALLLLFVFIAHL